MRSFEYVLNNETKKILAETPLEAGHIIFDKICEPVANKASIKFYKFVIRECDTLKDFSFTGSVVQFVPETKQYVIHVIQNK